MMSKKKKPFSWRKTFLIIFGCLLAISISIVSFILIVTSDARLDLSKITGAQAFEIEIYDLDGEVISTPSKKTFTKINEFTKDAFIAVEDKRFNSHNGIDIKRIGGALVANIKSGKKSQGASTITQQLVKNTHLSSEKSFSRKLKEMKLALELERAMTKDEIVTAYANSIYFGNGCMGIKDASNYYFGKNAEDLSIAESALLAGLAKAPSLLEPKNHLNDALERKNLVLRLMHDQKLIDDKQYDFALIEKLDFVFNKSKGEYDDYIEAAKTEACDILNISREELEMSEFKIETFAEKQAFNSIISNIESGKKENIGAILVDGNTGAVKAYFARGSFDFLNSKRQPGSAIKPILVYAPALEEKIVTPESFILDNKTNFDGYEPKNAGNTYSGWISTRQALATSKNVPAVKLLQLCGTEKAKKYASAAGIEFDENDTDLALALGGMTKGTTILELAGAYTTFPTGTYKKCSFVKRIIGKSGNVIYDHKAETKKVFSDDTAYLVYDMMKDCVLNGTAKRMKDLNFEVAAKTGTVGTESGNTDCYNVSITSNDVCVVAVSSGSTNTIRSNGSTTPTIAAKNILKEYYGNNTPPNAKLPNSVEYVALDSRALEQNKLCIISEDDDSAKYSSLRLFSKNNKPTAVFIDNKKVETASAESGKKYYSIIGRNKKGALPIKQRQSTDDLNSVIEQIMGL